MRHASLMVALGVLASQYVPAPASAQAPIRLGTEFQINTYTPNRQYTIGRSMAVEDNGDFVVVWTSEAGQDGDNKGVFGQRYSSSGARVGLEFQVSLYTTSSQTVPAVASDPEGDFVVVWQSIQDGAGTTGIFGRRFSASGLPQGLEFQVNVFTAGDQLLPAVASDADGDFVVAWQSNGGQDGELAGVFARRFNADGVAQGTEFQATNYTTSNQVRPAVDLDAAGRFVIVWQSFQGGGGDEIFGQRFDSGGNKQGQEFQVNIYALGTQSRPALGMDADGDFVVAWTGINAGGIFARRFDSVGTPQSGDFQVNTVTGNHTYASIAVDSTGDFVVAWEHFAADGTYNDVLARYFRASGIAIGDEIPVNTTVAGNQRAPAVGADADGDFVIAWESGGQDGPGGYAVIGQRFDVPALLDIDANGQLTALTDGVLVLRFLFGFTGDTLTAGAVGPNCGRCDGTTILAYLQSLT